MEFVLAQALLNTLVVAVTVKGFWLFQGLSERAGVTGECFAPNFP